LALQKSIIRETNMILLRQLPSVVGSREGWELNTIHNIPLPSFSASHDMGTYLSRIMFDSLMMAF
jgi:hypothetical protein